MLGQLIARCAIRLVIAGAIIAVGALSVGGAASPGKAGSASGYAYQASYQSN